MSRLYQRGLMKPAAVSPGGPPFGDTFFTTSDEGGGVASLINHTASGPLGGHTYAYAEGYDPSNEMDASSAKLISNTVDRGAALLKSGELEGSGGVWYASEALPSTGEVYFRLSAGILALIDTGLCLGFDPNEPAVAPVIALKAHNAGTVRLVRDWTVTSGAGSCLASTGDRLLVVLDLDTGIATVTNETTPDVGTLTALNFPTNPTRFGIYAASRFSRNDWFYNAEWGVGDGT